MDLNNVMRSNIWGLITLQRETNPRENAPKNSFFSMDMEIIINFEVV